MVSRQAAKIRRDAKLAKANMNILKQIYPAIAITVVLTVLLGIIYPLVVTGLAQVVFPKQAAGSLIEKGGKVIGSSLIGQPFSGRGYFHSRPSAAGTGYDATASGGTNLGPTSQKLMDNVKTAADALREENPGTPIPIDMVTASASGLDPHITPAAAEFQVPRIARERGMTADEVRRLVLEHTEGRQFGLLGEPRVNVLELNLALDGAAR
jgi:potassium-transporting ATPase KdpC subunit